MNAPLHFVVYFSSSTNFIVLTRVYQNTHLAKLFISKIRKQNVWHFVQNVWSLRNVLETRKLRLFPFTNGINGAERSVCTEPLRQVGPFENKDFYFPLCIARYLVA